MRRLVTVGTLSLASLLGASCDDDTDGINPGVDGGTGGIGVGGTNSGSGGDGGSSALAGSGGTSIVGSAGAGGAAGNVGSAGSSGAAGSSAGASGAAGSGSTVPPDAGTGDAGTGDAGDGGAPPPCTGCVELRVPFTAINQAAFFQIVFSTRSLSDTVATFRVGAEVLDQTGQTYVYAFATDNSGFTQLAATFTLINAANFTDTDTFIDLALDFANLSNVDFDEANVIAVGLQVGSGGALAGSTTSVLIVDSVTFTGTSGLTNLSFTSDDGGFVRNENAGLQTATTLHHPE